MHDSIRNHLEELANQDRPTDLHEFLQQAAQREPRISAHQSWAMMAMMNYRQFKSQALRIFTSEILPTYGRKYGATAFDFEGLVYVPSMPEWVFFACGCEDGRNGCYFANRVTGKQIHFDVTTGPDHLSCHDFGEHLIHEPNLEFAEQRLDELCPALFETLQQLVDLGVLHDQESFDSDLAEVEIDVEFNKYTDCFERLHRQLSSPEDQLWIAAWCGDWVAAHEAARQLGDETLIVITEVRAEDSRNEWLHAQGVTSATLRSLADAPDRSKHIEAAMADTELACTAIDIVKDDPAWCPQAFRLLSENRRGPLREKCARYLVKHGFRTRDVIWQLNGSREHGLAIVLAVEDAPEMLLTLLRCGLRSVHDQTRLISAAVLALFDKEWSRRELVVMLDESHDPVETRYYRAAMRESRDHSAWRVADDWESQNPLVDQMSLRNEMDEKVLQKKMTELFDRVMRIRDSYRPG